MGRNTKYIHKSLKGNNQVKVLQAIQSPIEYMNRKDTT